jgi:hypothetical protein
LPRFEGVALHGLKDKTGGHGLAGEMPLQEILEHYAVVSDAVTATILPTIAARILTDGTASFVR